MIVEMYEKENGEVPVKEFLDSLPSKLANKTIENIVYLGERGYLLKMPKVEKLDADIWQLRTKQSSNITRILYFFFDEEKIILTNGFVKKTMKTPKNEIQKAKDFRIDYYRRHK